MITVVDAHFRMSKVSETKLGNDFIYSLEEGLESVKLNFFDGKSVTLDCDGSIIGSMYSTDDDDSIEEELAGNIFDKYNLIIDEDYDNIELVLLNNEYFRIINYNNKKLLHSEKSKKVYCECNNESLLELLYSIDSDFKAYKRYDVFI